MNHVLKNTTDFGLIFCLYLRSLIRIMKKDLFVNRHIGPSVQETNEMLKAVNAESIDALIQQTIPEKIRLKSPLNTGEAMTEFEYLNHLRAVAGKNKVFRSYIGLGYSGTILPAASACPIAGTSVIHFRLVLFA